MIKLIDINKIYNYGTNKEVVALKNINLDIKKNNLILLMGPSGSGKSTILSLIAGFIKPTSGEVIVDNIKVSKMSENFIPSFRREKIGFIFQKFNLIDDLSLFDNIVLPLIPAQLSFDDIENKANDLLKQFNLIEKKNILVKNLSGGEQQRVAIIRSLINDANILIADEPSANLDKRLVDNFIDILRFLKQNNKTIIISTHDKTFESLDFVDNIIRIENGSLVC